MCLCIYLLYTYIFLLENFILHLISRQEYLIFRMLTRQAYFRGKGTLNINFHCIHVLIFINWLKMQNKVQLMPIIIN